MICLQCTGCSYQSYRACATLPAGLGVKLVIVIGARPQINRAVRERGAEPQYAHGYRVTDPASLQVTARGTAFAAAAGQREGWVAACMFVLNCSSCWCGLPRQHATASNGQHTSTSNCCC